MLDMHSLVNIGLYVARYVKTIGLILVIQYMLLFEIVIIITVNMFVFINALTMAQNGKELLYKGGNKAKNF